MDRCGGTLRAIIGRTLRECGCRASREAVDEVEQELFCRLLGRRARGAGWVDVGERAARSYVARVARAVIIDRKRHAAARKRRHEAARGHEVVPLDHLRGPEIDPESKALVGERVHRVARCCRAVAGRRNRRLKEQALLMVVLGGCCSHEVSAALGGRISTTHVDTLVSRLRSRLAAGGDTLPRRRPGPAAARNRTTRRVPRAA